jgi:putative addiction module antidote
MVDGYNKCSYTTAMTMQFKLKAIGNSVGLILPKEELARLGVGKGDTLTGVAKPGGIELRAADPEFERQMAAAEKVMARYKNALRELAK